MTANNMHNDKPRYLALRTTALYPVIIILLVSFAVYFNTLYNGFVYDDKHQILGNYWIRNVSFIPDIFTSNAWGYFYKSAITNYYRPMMHLIYMLDYYIFGLRPWGFHLVNVLFHAAVSAMVFIIARELIEKRQGISSPSNHPEFRAVLPAFAASLLFATHPVHTEAVAWAAGLPDLSYTFFFLISFHCYMRSEGGAQAHYVLSLIFFFIAALCKEPALILPFILMLYDCAFPRALGNGVTRGGVTFSTLVLKRYTPFFAVAGVYLALRFHVLGGFTPMEPPIKLNTYGYIINIFPLFAEYLNKLLLPLNLNAFHVFHPVSSAFSPKAILSIAVTAAFLVVTFVAAKRNRILFFCLAMTALPLLPALYIRALGKNVFAERYLYLPSVGFVLLIAISLPGNLKQGFIRVFVIVFSAVVVLCCAATISRNAVWRDELVLFSDTVKKSPDGDIPHNNLGIAYAERKRFDEAIHEYKTALKLNPFSAEAFNNLALAYAAQDRFRDAIREYRNSLNLSPYYAETHYNLALAYAAQNWFSDAISEYTTSLQLNPYSAEAHYNLGNAYLAVDRPDRAVEHYQIAITLKPDYAAAYYNLGAAYMKMGLTEKARSELTAGLKIHPENEAARRLLDQITHTK